LLTSLLTVKISNFVDVRADSQHHIETFENKSQDRKRPTRFFLIFLKISNTMKAATIVCLFALFAVSEAAQLQVSPITRVVNLLKGLAKQVEADGDKEKDLYEGFVCWGKSVIAQKTETNRVATARIDALTTYISDLNGGDVTLTSEAEDLKKQIKELSTDKKQMEDDNVERIKNYDAAKAEMDNALTALGMAINVLKEGTSFAQSGKAKANLLAYKTELGQGMAALEVQSANLNSAVELGDRYLSKADASFLRRVLTGDVPVRDEKMLRKKADFKEKYTKRSTKIQVILDRLKRTFAKNLADTVASENKAKADYAKLHTSKSSALTAALAAQTSGAVEGAAKTKALNNAGTEKTDLQKQVTDDTRFMTETQTSLDLKKREWDARTTLREGELTAISKAINILYNDDARDNFQKSLNSQEGFFFLQEGSVVTASAQAKVMTNLKAIARQTKNERMSAIADLVALAAPTTQAADAAAQQAKFKTVIDAIDTMITTLGSDEANDLKTKEDCEKARMLDTREALVQAREMDDQTDAIRKLRSEIAELVQDMKENKAEEAARAKELAEATTLRGKETAAWVVTNQEDTDAITAVTNAETVLKDFYLKSAPAATTLLTIKAPTVVEGEAPPPPPSTWGAGVQDTRSSGESQGIISILGMVKEDIIKDKTKAKDEEDQDEVDFQTFKTKSGAQEAELLKIWNTKDGIKGGKQGEASTKTGQRDTKFGAWKANMADLATAEGNCEYFAVNFKLRAANRAIEKDGLNNAKTILSGGSLK